MIRIATAFFVWLYVKLASGADTADARDMARKPHPEATLKEVIAHTLRIYEDGKHSHLTEAICRQTPSLALLSSWGEQKRAIEAMIANEVQRDQLLGEAAA